MTTQPLLPSLQPLPFLILSEILGISPFPEGVRKNVDKLWVRRFPVPSMVGECWGRGMVISGFFGASSLVVQSLRLCISNVGTAGLISGQGTKIPHVAGHSQKKRKKKLFFLASHEGQLPEVRVVGGRALLLICLFAYSAHLAPSCQSILPQVRGIFHVLLRNKKKS